MKRTDINIFGLALVGLAIGVGSCSQSDEWGIETATDNGELQYTCELVLQGAKPSFNVGTRAIGANASERWNTRAEEESQEWASGSKIYLQLMSEGKTIRGEAVYNSSTSEWTLTSTSTPAKGASTAEAYYFENVTTTNTGLSFTDSTVIYQDLNAQYSFDGTKLIAAVTLKPKTGRVRFTGEAQSEVFVKGITRYSAYNAGRNAFTTTDAPIRLVVNGEYTPYVYGFFTDSINRELVVSSAKTAFRQIFNANVLKVGESGYMDLPTESEPRGWASLSPFASLSIPDSIGEERAKIISDWIDEMVKVESKEYNFQSLYPTIVSPFFISKYEVTQKLYRAVMNREFKNNYSQVMDEYPIFSYVDESNTQIPVPSEGYGPNLDAVQVEFMNKLCLLTGLHFDYPTEAEWEFAARGGQNIVAYYTYAGGNNYTNLAQSSSYGWGVNKVGQKSPNELGLYDMTGNVSEVCRYIGKSFTSGTLYVNPAPVEGYYVWRGGNNYALSSSAGTYAAINNRFNHRYVDSYYSYYGLRPVLRYLD